MSALVLGALLRASLLPLPGTEDVTSWKLWSYAASQDVVGVYGIGGEPPTRGVVRWRDVEGTVNYPPIAMYEFAVIGHLYRWLRPGFPDGPLLLAAIKVPLLVADGLLAWLLHAAVFWTTGRRDRARWTALAWWLNPASLLLGAALGYVDGLFMLPACAALVAASVNRPAWAGLLFAVAVWTKPQAVYVGPFVLLAVWQVARWRGLLRTTLAGTLVSVVAVLPYALAGALPNMWLAFGSFWARRDTLSAQAANLWWIVNYVLRVLAAIPDLGLRQAILMIVPRPLAISRFQELGYVNPRPWTAAAVLGCLGWAVWCVRRRATLALHAAGASFTVHAAFVLGVGAHENHQVLQVPLLALAAAGSPRLRPLFWVVSGVVALNLNLFYGISRGWGWAVPRSLTLVDLTVVVAAVNCVALVWHGRLLTHEAAARTTPVE